MWDGWGRFLLLVGSWWSVSSWGQRFQGKGSRGRCLREEGDYILQSGCF